MIIAYSRKKDSNVLVAKNFRVGEFACPDGADEILLDDTLPPVLQLLRDCMELSMMEIESGFRTAKYNSNIGGAVGSYHTLGRAVDVRPYKNGAPSDPHYLCCAAEVIGVNGIGIMQTCIHIDTRPERAWFDEKFKNRRIWDLKPGCQSWFGYYGITNLDFMKNPYHEPIETLQRGSHGDGVKWLQFELIKAGYMPLLNSDGECNIDGIFGGITEAVVIAYQIDREIIPGVVGEVTRKLICA